MDFAYLDLKSNKLNMRWKTNFYVYVYYIDL